MSFVWSEAEVERLKAFHAQGLSGTEIALRFGAGLTRSAIFGKLHRLGLTGQRSGETGRLTPRLAARGAASGTRRLAPASAPRAVPPKFNFARKGAFPLRAREEGDPPSPRVLPLPPPSLQIPLLDVTRGQCRFIAGEDGRDCGHPVAEGSSWCPAHRALVFAEDAA